MGLCRVDRFKIALVLLLKLLTCFIKKVRGDDVAYKVDIHKPFDTLSWKFLLLNQVCSSFEESKSFKFDGRLDVLVVAEVF